MEKFTLWVGAVVVVLLLATGISALLAVPVWLLFNWLGLLFGLPHLSLLQAWGLHLLCGMLFRAESPSKETK